VLHVRRGGSAAAVQSNAAAAVYLNSMYFALNQVVGSSDFTNLFDEYRINCVVVKLIPRVNTVQTLANGTEIPNNYVPNLHWVYDYDDANVPSNTDTLLEYGNYRVKAFDRPITWKIKPKYALAAYSGAFTSYKPMRGWLDVASPSIQHYGVKFAVDTLQPSQYTSFVIRPIYYISFRNTR